jgi:hypothetical protein
VFWDVAGDETCIAVFDADKWGSGVGNPVE